MGRRAARYAGIGETAATAFRAPLDALDYWEERLRQVSIPVEAAGIRFGEPVLRFSDPDGMRLELVGVAGGSAVTPSRWADVPAACALQGFHSVTLSEHALEPTAEVLTAMGLQQTEREGDRVRYSAAGNAAGTLVDIKLESQRTHGRLGAGSVHHIAFRVPDDPTQLAWREALAEHDLYVTPVRDRMYFHSIYFREHGGVLFELATDPPGFAADEPEATLGESLKLPPWFEDKRPVLEKALPPLTVKTGTPGAMA